MGGQACVFYGAAEFSRDLDLLIHLDPTNLNNLGAAMGEMCAVPIAVPSFSRPFLDRGHAVHFRCSREDLNQLRIDVMSRLRGVAAFATLWDRRTMIEVDGVPVDLMGIEDLVLAKKTQRNKDWPMIQRLVEQHYSVHRRQPSEAAICFWLRELRTPELIREVIETYPEQARGARMTRPALNGDLEISLRIEEDEERARDRKYWKPLREELERLRMEKARADR